MDVRILNTYHLGFVKVMHYSNGMVELIGSQGITVSADNIREMFVLFETLRPKPLVALTNRKHSYSFSFEAQREIFHYRGVVKSLAILTHSRFAYLAAKFSQAKFFDIGVFLQRAEALNWLEKQLQDINNNDNDFPGKRK